MGFRESDKFLGIETKGESLACCIPCGVAWNLSSSRSPPDCESSAKQQSLRNTESAFELYPNSMMCLANQEDVFMKSKLSWGTVGYGPVPFCFETFSKRLKWKHTRHVWTEQGSLFKRCPQDNPSLLKCINHHRCWGSVVWLRVRKTKTKKIGCKWSVDHHKSPKLLQVNFFEFPQGHQKNSLCHTDPGTTLSDQSIVKRATLLGCESAVDRAVNKPRQHLYIQYDNGSLNLSWHSKSTTVRQER